MPPFSVRRVRFSLNALTLKKMKDDFFHFLCPNKNDLTSSDFHCTVLIITFFSTQVKKECVSTHHLGLGLLAGDENLFVCILNREDKSTNSKRMEKRIERNFHLYMIIKCCNEIESMYYLVLHVLCDNPNAIRMIGVAFPFVDYCDIPEFLLLPFI